MRTRYSPLLIAAVLLALLLGACGSGTPAGAAPVAVSEAALPAAEAAPTAAPAVVGEQHNGMPVGFTPEGFPYRGSPDAPVTLYEFSDFQCPFCGRHFVQTEPALNESYVQTGKVQVVFRDLPLEGLHPNAPAAHEAAACIAEQGAPLFWAMHDALFQAQDEWAESSDPAPVFARLAGEIGADGAAYAACIAGGEKTAQIQASVEEAAALGFDGTPSFRIVDNASGTGYNLIGAQPYARFAENLDAVLAGSEPPIASQQETAPAGIPFWATADGIALDPARPGYTVAGDQTRGNPDASVVVVEFSDFQCPYCKQHMEQTQPSLDEQFVDTGEVRWVFKHFPLAIHPQAPAAGVAAECAADQGKFWEMHSALFESVSNWSTSDPTPALVEVAANLGLDTAAFSECLADPARMELVNADMADGASYVQGTPTFVILFNGQGRIIPGALPLPTFAAELQKAIDATQS